MSNVNYDRYLSMLMKKYPLQSESEDPEGTLKGGSGKTGDAPFGGFPPIFICSRDTKMNTDENKNREYSTHKTAVSIKDIMQRRRDIVPFITS